MTRLSYLLILLLLTVTLAAEDFSLQVDFSDSTSYEIFNYKGRVPAQAEGSGVMLMNGGYASNHNNSVKINSVIAGSHRKETISFNLFITPGGDGAGIALLNKDFINEDSLSYIAKHWEAPDFKKAFGVGFDIYNPQTSAWFDKYGNFYGRPQREISLHWDGREVYKIMSPVEFRSDPMHDVIHKMQINLNYVTGGAEASVSIDDTLVIENFFIAEMMPYDKVPVVGATTSDFTTTVYVDSLSFSGTEEPVEQNLKQSFVLVDNMEFHSKNREEYKEVKFPKVGKKIGRVIMTLDLGGLAGGPSGWDVGSSINLLDADSTKYEICRFITPYHRGYIWKVDVTDLLPLFKGKKTVRVNVSTWEPITEDPSKQKGWKVHAKLDYYEGPSEYRPVDVVNLWAGNEEYGNPEKPLSDFFDTREVKVPRKTDKVKIRFVVTGHGMSPNSNNAAEFMPADRTFIVNGKEFHNRLWKTDCYLNPCRPQGGTWKFDRAGWAPGDVVKAWEIDITDYVDEDGKLNLQYIPMEYINENRSDKTYPPHHLIETQLIYYKKR